MLMSAGAKAEVDDGGPGCFPLFMAAQEGELAIVRLLVEVSRIHDGASTGPAVLFRCMMELHSNCDA